MKTFEELALITPIKKALHEEQYVTPTPIQAQTIPAALSGRDILGSAQTGTGKTAAFALPILNRLGKRSKKSMPHFPQVLILAPTRELAIQIGDSLETYGRHLRLRHTLIYGGVNQFRQVRALKKGVHIVVATPGRLLDLMNQGHLELSRLEVFVLDEADRMLDMGFLPDLKRIIRELPDERQSMFFSATFPGKILQLSEELLNDPISVRLAPAQPTVEAIEQQLFHVTSGQKKSLLAKMLRDPNVGQAVVFTKTKRGATNLANFLQKANISADEIHGNKTQNARQRTLDGFRGGKFQVLVATDVAARGIDVDGITHVFNLDLPIEPEAYVHRIGRTGRAGETGIAVSFCGPEERGLLRAIERQIGQKIPLAAGQEEPQRSRRDDESEPRGERRERRGGNSGGPRNQRPRRKPRPQRRDESGAPKSQEKRSAPAKSESRDAKPSHGKFKARRRPKNGAGRRPSRAAAPA
ncbi:MAG: DEAD/DEAH box helicase [Planctomycetaceae bacterium]|nr:DEAD/DEAH box helicase [Planctomycetaceae bacterium]